MMRGARGLTVVAFAAALGIGAAAKAAEVGHVRLVAALDRPIDGYCLDILGVGETLRTDVPLFAHNCKPTLTPDSAVALTPEGRIWFPAVDLCATAMGVNSRSLPGSPILLRPCGARTPFFESSALQAFTLEADGRLRLEGSDLCLAVGAASATTYSPRDAWRDLSVELCDAVPPERARWRFDQGPF